MTAPTITARGRNRALLARQLLLERSGESLETAVEQVGGLQMQYAASGYVGLWTRLESFERDALTRALEARSVVQATLMRTTIHLVARHDYWAYALGVRQARRAWLSRVDADAAARMSSRAAELRVALADGPRWARELGEAGSGFLGSVGVWLDLVRVPPSGTWTRRRADRLALAEQWLGDPDVSEDEGLTHLVRAYLRAFGPAQWRDVASWAGLSVAEARRGGASLSLVRLRTEDGTELVDLPGALLPAPDTPAPIRFLPHWDATLLVHARGSGILPEVHRPLVFSTRNPFSVGTVLMDGRVVAAWSVREGRVIVEPFEPLDRRTRDGIEDERARLEAFHA